ncbi:MAG: AraC family transcriptional regulator [Candidatus Zixiibacteriota bacterium]
MPDQNSYPSQFLVVRSRQAISSSAGLIDIRARLEKARRFIDANYHLPIDLDLVAREACFSRFHFIRSFRAVFGITPHQYLMRTRVEKAKELLIMQKYNVTEVCFEVGFESLGSFSTLFKRISGQPPIAYRAGIFRPVPKSLIWPKLLVPYCLISKILGPQQKSNIREALPPSAAHIGPNSNIGDEL